MRNFLLLILLFSSFYTRAQVVFNEFNINGSGDSYPKEFTILNGKLYFSAGSNPDGMELFTTDGVYVNTHVVANINAGSASSFPTDITLLGSKMVFVADGNNKGKELWQSDGTSAGTTLLSDMYVGAVASNPEHLTYYDGKVYFSSFASNGAFNELWATDGTTAGTKMVKDICAGCGSYVKELHVYGGKLYFQASDATNGEELWVSDGSDTGTKMVKNIVAMPSIGSAPNNFVEAGGKLFFIANSNGAELWVTDGTTTGTQLVKEIGGGILGGVSASFLIAYKGELYMNAGNSGAGGAGFELWKSDGTSAGTVQVAELSPGVAQSFLTWPVIYNNKIYFAANTSADGNELWETDGTAAGTKIVKDITSGAGSSNPSHLTLYKNKIYFAAEYAPGDTQVFVSDGTAAGTKVLLNPTATKSNPLSAKGFNGFAEYNGELYFAAEYTNTGFELWALRDTTVPIHIAHTGNAANEVRLYPNPATHHCTVLLPAGNTSGSITIYNMNGAMQYSQPYHTNEGRITIATANMPKGLYTVKVACNGEVVYNKLLLQ